MKKALLIIAAVGGYCALESSFLLGMLTSVFWQWTTLRSHEEILFWVQLFAMPGLAALLSRVIYGPEKWLHRALLILLLGAFLAPALLLLIVIIGAPSAWAFSISKGLFAVMLPVLLGTAGLAVGWVVRKGIRRGIRLAARKWTTDRELGVTAADRKWHGRGLRIAVCIPFMTVLLVFLFLPETWGILSHLTQPGAGSLAGYQLSIPATWVINSRWSQGEGGGSFVSGLAGQGKAMGVAPYLRADLPFGGWSVGTEPYRQPGAGGYQSPHIFRSNEDEVVAKRDFFIGKDRLTCEEYLPAFVRRAHFFYDSSLVFIRCDGSGGLYASMVGKRHFVSGFYKMIEGIAASK